MRPSVLIFPSMYTSATCARASLFSVHAGAHPSRWERRPSAAARVGRSASRLENLPRVLLAHDQLLQPVPLHSLLRRLRALSGERTRGKGEAQRARAKRHVVHRQITAAPPAEGGVCGAAVPGGDAKGGGAVSQDERCAP